MLSEAGPLQNGLVLTRQKLDSKNGTVDDVYEHECHTQKATGTLRGWNECQQVQGMESAAQRWLSPWKTGKAEQTGSVGEIEPY